MVRHSVRTSLPMSLIQEGRRVLRCKASSRSSLDIEPSGRGRGPEFMDGQELIADARHPRQDRAPSAAEERTYGDGFRASANAPNTRSSTPTAWVRWWMKS